jgi:hypothetical protein
MKQETNSEEFSCRERILGNPVYNYQLLKRLIVYYKKVESAVEKTDSSGE